MVEAGRKPASLSGSHENRLFSGRFEARPRPCSETRRGSKTRRRPTREQPVLGAARATFVRKLGVRPARVRGATCVQRSGCVPARPRRGRGTLGRTWSAPAGAVRDAVAAGGGCYVGGIVVLVTVVDGHMPRGARGSGRFSFRDGVTRREGLYRGRCICRRYRRQRRVHC
jgi:hypothetical protein